METLNFSATGFNESPVSTKAVEGTEDKLSLALQSFVEGEKDTEEDTLEQNNMYSSVVSFVTDKFTRAKTARYNDEQRWLKCYNNFRGIYGPDVQFTETEKSKAFIKITKTKVLAAFGKITEVLFSAKKFPIGIEPTPIPEGVAESVYFDPKENEVKKKSQEAGINTIARPSIKESIDKKLGPLKYIQEKLPDDVELKEGVGKTPTSYTFEPAKEAAKYAEKQIQDQIEESNGSKHLRTTIHEMCLFGTGVMKGPFAQDKEYPRWGEDGKYNPLIKTVPDISSVSIWNCYPDPSARSKEDCDYFIERHRMNKTQLRSLKKRPYFRENSIELAISQGPNYIEEHWEYVLDDTNNNGYSTDRWEVLEYWGYLDKDVAEQANLEIPEELQELDQIQVNIWVCNNQILRLVLNPFTPTNIPYYVCPYELNPYSMFGIGIAENMLDTQLIMNGFMRLAIDNAVLSSNLVFEVDETNLVPGQNMQVYPGKVFRRQSGAPGQAIFAQKYPNVTQECMLLFDKARQLSDEATGMPSYAHGISGVMSTGRTASGMSMLMEAAQENIRSVIRNVDDYLLVPLGEAIYSFNMQFNFDKKMQGDLIVVARGTESLLRNEMRAQKLMQFMQMTNNEMDAPWVKRDYALREISRDLDLDSEKLVNDSREAAIQAETLRKYREAMGTVENPLQQGQQGTGGGEGNLTPPSDPTGNGNGNMNPGMSPKPNDEGFSGAMPPNLGSPNG